MDVGVTCQSRLLGTSCCVSRVSYLCACVFVCVGACMRACGLLQLPILASSVVSLYFLELTDVFQPVHSGYSCNDRSLSLPYILPRQEVCPLPLLFSLAFAAPTATVSKPLSL